MQKEIVMTKTHGPTEWEQFYDWFAFGILPGSPSPSSPAQPADAARPPAADRWLGTNHELGQPQVQL
jgi:hypothetical protein